MNNRKGGAGDVTTVKLTGVVPVGRVLRCSPGFLVTVPRSRAVRVDEFSQFDVAIDPLLALKDTIRRFASA